MREAVLAPTSPITKITTTPTYEMVEQGTFVKGQFVRLFLSKNNTVRSKF